MSPQEQLMAIFGQRSEGQGSGPRISHEVQIERLREAAARYARPCPFVVGDLVTPLTESHVKGAGEPHLVVDVRPGPVDSFGRVEPLFQGELGSSAFGMRLDVRILSLIDGETIAPHWVESWCLERWTK